MVTHIQKILDNQPLTANTQKMERKSVDEHISKPLLGKSQTKSGKKSTPLTDQTQQKFENKYLSAKTKTEDLFVRQTYVYASAR